MSLQNMCRLRHMCGSRIHGLSGFSPKIITPNRMEKLASDGKVIRHAFRNLAHLPYTGSMADFEL